MEGGRGDEREGLINGGMRREGGRQRKGERGGTGGREEK